MLVSDAMTTPCVVVGPDVTVDELAKTLEGRSISAVPVVTDDRLVGLVSTSDLVRALASPTDEPLSARSVMSTEVLVARADEHLDEAARRMTASRVHRLVVVDGERPLGVLSARDVLGGLQARRITAPLGSIMTTPVETVEIGDSIALAMERLAAANVHGLVVIDERAPVGVFTHREALAVRRLPQTLRGRPVEEIMSYETICLDVSTPIFRAVGHGIAMNVRRFLVVEQRSLAGIVSCLDLASVLARAD